MDFSFNHDGILYSGMTVAAALDMGVPLQVALDGYRAGLIRAIEAEIDRTRSRLHETSASKLAAYRVKEEIARDPAAASAAELALLDAEAAARGLDRAGLMAAITAKAAVLREAVLQLEVANAGAKATIEAALTEADLTAAHETALAGIAAAAATATIILGAI